MSRKLPVAVVDNENIRDSNFSLASKVEVGSPPVSITVGVIFKFSGPEMALHGVWLWGGVRGIPLERFHTQHILSLQRPVPSVLHKGSVT